MQYVFFLRGCKRDKSDFHASYINNKKVHHVKICAYRINMQISQENQMKFADFLLPSVVSEFPPAKSFHPDQKNEIKVKFNMFTFTCCEMFFVVGTVNDR